MDFVHTVNGVRNAILLSQNPKQQLAQQGSAQFQIGTRGWV
jgi:hypothetical protein